MEKGITKFCAGQKNYHIAESECRLQNLVATTIQIQQYNINRSYASTWITAGSWANWIPRIKANVTATLLILAFVNCIQYFKAKEQY